MIHELNKEHFDRVDLGLYNLTMDDGNYFQYYYSPLLAGFDVIIFPITQYVQFRPPRGTFKGKFLVAPSRKEMMAQWKIYGDYQNAINLEELTILIEQGWEVGAHSHFHELTLDFGKYERLNGWRKKMFMEAAGIPDKNYYATSRLAKAGFEIRNGETHNRTQQEYVDFIRLDTERCLEWFHKYLNIRPTKYCFPFNRSSDLLIEELKAFGFKEFFGQERIDIDRL